MTSPVLRATLKNFAWLFGGKGVGGVFSLVYLALAARGLGPEAFGQFALVLAYGQAVTNLVQFQSWQLVIRYGSKHLADGHPARLARVVAFTALLDVGAGVAATIAAVIGVRLVGPAFGWSGDVQLYAALFGCSLFFSIRATPVGILRLFGRFDLATYADTVTPAVRLVGAAGAYALHPSIGAFLVAWACGEVLTSLAMWTAAIGEIRRCDALPGRDTRLKGITTENPGLWRFAWTTNLSTSVNLLWQQMATLSIGWAAGPASVGGYRVASQFAQALAKPATLLNRSIYPELAKLVGAGRYDAVRSSLDRSLAVSAAIGVGTVLLIAVVGEPLIRLVAGEEYAFAGTILIVLAAATAIDFAGFSLEPTLLALGHPGVALAIRGVVGLGYVGALVLLIPLYGAMGAAFAGVLGSLILQGAMLLACRHHLREHAAQAGLREAAQGVDAV